MSAEVYRPTVDPGINPGGLWVRICAGDELVTEHPLGCASDEAGAQDALLALDAAKRHGEARTFLYDGDSGVCFGTLVTRPCGATGRA